MNKLGIIGKPSDWLISCNVDRNKLKDLFDIKLIDISSSELIELINSHKEEIPVNLLNAKYDKAQLDLAYQIYLAIMDLVNKYQLEGFTIRCFDLLNTVHSTSCLALALANDQGIIGTCEGDIPAMISMFLIKKTLNKFSFQANPSEIDINNSSIILAHCTLPLKMCSSYKLTTHYESGIGVAIKGELSENAKCFIFRLGPNLDKFVILEGEIKKNLSRLNLCRTQIEVDIKDNINYFLTNPLGNHHIIVYGDDHKELENYLNKKGLSKIS